MGCSVVPVRAGGLASFGLVFACGPTLNFGATETEATSAAASTASTDSAAVTSASTGDGDGDETTESESTESESTETTGMPDGGCAIAVDCVLDCGVPSACSESCVAGLSEDSRIAYGRLRACLSTACSAWGQCTGQTADTKCDACVLKGFGEAGPYGCPGEAAVCEI